MSVTITFTRFHKRQKKTLVDFVGQTDMDTYLTWYVLNKSDLPTKALRLRLKQIFKNAEIINGTTIN